MKFKLFCLGISCLILLFFNSKSFSKDFYVSPTGSGSTCSKINPCNIYEAFEQIKNISSDSTIYLKEGYYKLKKDLNLFPAKNSVLPNKNKIKIYIKTKKDYKNFIVIDGNNYSFTIDLDKKIDLYFQMDRTTVIQNFDYINFYLSGSSLYIENTVFSNNHIFSIKDKGKVVLKENKFIKTIDTVTSGLSILLDSDSKILLEDNFFTNRNIKSMWNFSFVAGDIYISSNSFINIAFNNNVNNAIEIKTNLLRFENNIFSNLSASFLDNKLNTYPYLITINPLINNIYKLIIFNNTFYGNKRIFTVKPNKGFLLYISDKLNNNKRIDTIYGKTVYLVNNIFENNKTLGCPIAKDVLFDFDNLGQPLTYITRNIFSDCIDGEEDKCVITYTNYAKANNYWNKKSGMIAPEENNFSLTKNSFAVNKGYKGDEDIKAPKYDYFGRLRNKIDIGAVEYIDKYNGYLTVNVKGNGIIGWINGASSFPSKYFFGNNEVSNSGQYVTYSLEAIPDIFSKFVKWEGDCDYCGSMKTCQISLFENKNIVCTAVFEKELYTLEIEKNSSYGSVFVDIYGKLCNFQKVNDKYICKIKVPKNQYVTLYTVNNFYLSENGNVISFDSWGGNCDNCKNNINCTIFTDKDKRCVLKQKSFNPNISYFDTGTSNSPYQYFNPSGIQQTSEEGKTGSGCNIGTGNQVLGLFIILFFVLSRKILLSRK